MKVWGITGLLGAGKTTATDHIKSLGFPVIDADQVSRLVIDKKTEIGKDGFAKVYRAFGNTVLDNLGNLDRTALRKRIMMNPHEKEILEGILNPLMHEHVRKIMTEWKSSGVEIGFIEGARILEAGFHNLLAGVIRVHASEDQRIKRLIKRDSMGKDEVTMLVQLQDAGLILRLPKVEWKNDKKPKDLEALIETFIETRLAEGV